MLAMSSNGTTDRHAHWRKKREPRRKRAGRAAPDADAVSNTIDSCDAIEAVNNTFVVVVVIVFDRTSGGDDGASASSPLASR